MEYTSILEVLGLLVIALGVGLIYLPAGVIMAGLAACLLGYLLGPDPKLPTLPNSHSEDSP